MLFAFTAVSAVAPSLLLLWYFYRRDLNREPPRPLLITFLLGVLAVFATLALSLPIGKPVAARLAEPHFKAAAEAFLCAALPEELCKFCVLWFYAARSRAFDEPMDGIVYGVVASLGFATLENVLYVAAGGLGTAVARAVLSVPSHAFWGAIMGYHAGQARFRTEGRGRQLALALAVPTLLHGLYDLPLMAMTNVNAALGPGRAGGTAAWAIPATLGVVVFSWRWTLRQVRRLRAGQLQAAGLPPPLPGPPTNAGLAWTLLLGGGALASVGGLLLLGCLLTAALASAAERGTLLAAAAIVGLPPTLVGAWLFRAGLRRLPGRPAA